MARLKHLYPFLFAIIPILNVVSRNPGYAAGTDVLIVLGAMLVGCAVLYALLLVVVRGFASLASWILALGVLGFYGLVPLARFLRESWVGGLALLLACLGAVGLMSWRLIRNRAGLERVGSFLTLSGCLVAASLLTQISVHAVHARSAIARSPLAKRLAQPVPTKAGRRLEGPTPDIYLLILDEYANSAVLKERFNFDNRAFEDSLRQLGFTIPRSVRSNYSQTVLSLPSLLNFSHLTDLTAELGPKATDITLPNYLLQHNRTVAFLKGQGYTFLFYPSQWWPATRHNRSADQEYQAWHGFHLGRELSRSHFRRTLVRMTVLGQFVRDAPYDTDHVLRTLDALKAVPTDRRPTFAFAHIINPHYPYVFQADCRPVPSGTTEGRKPAYIHQLRCLNHLVLGTVTTLLKTSAHPPLIVLQGDHGTSTLNFTWAPSAAAVSPTQARERFGAFGAYYLPNGGSRLVSDSVTLVNVFQRILSYYFGADAPPSGDQLYMSLEQRPYDFVTVDPDRLRVPSVNRDQ